MASEKFQISRDSRALYITIVTKDRLPVFRTDSIGVDADQVAESDRNDESVLTQHSRSPVRKPEEYSAPLTTTRVDVDVRGKRTLVNAMR